MSDNKTFERTACRPHRGNADTLAQGDFGPQDRAKFEKKLAQAQDLARQIKLEEARMGIPRKPALAAGDHAETHEDREHRAAFRS